VRFELLRVNYRLPLNFTLAGLDGARTSLARLDEWAERLAIHAGQAAPAPTDLSAYAERFFDTLDDDLNISGALGHLFDLVRESNRALDAGTLTPAQAAQALGDWHRINQVLALEREADAIPAEVTALAEERQQARAAKEWKRSDELRDQIAALGWTIKDGKDGAKLSRKI
jgi:cysteinyl-tRNA synthetase